MISQTESIIASIGKSNVLTRDLDETVSDVTDTVESLGDTVESHSTQIAQNAHNITLKASQSEVDSISGDVTTLKGQVVTITADYVQFTDLATEGSTEINGSNITTGSISADIISGGSLSGSSINIGDGNFVVDSDGHMTCTGASIQGENIVVGQGEGESIIDNSQVTANTIMARDALQIGNCSILPGTGTVSHSTTATLTISHDTGATYYKARVTLPSSESTHKNIIKVGFSVKFKKKNSALPIYYTQVLDFELPAGSTSTS